MNKLNFQTISVSCFTIVYLIVVFLLTSSCGPGVKFSRNPEDDIITSPGNPDTVTWNDGSGFNQGEFDGTEPTGNGELQLHLRFESNQLCVAASGENAVYLHKYNNPDEKIKVNLPKFGSEATVNPSRTSIDKYGNCWVGGRGNGGIYKVAKDGKGKDGTGILGKLQLSDPSNPSVKGGNARAVAIDKDGFVWVGNHDHYVVWKINPQEDSLGNLKVAAGPFYTVENAPSHNGAPYGAGVDSKGNIWVVGCYDKKCLTGTNLANGFASKFNSDGTIMKTVRTDVYGIAFDNDDNAWIGGCTAGTLNKIDKTSYALTKIVLANKTGTTNIDSRGIGRDNKGNIWVADLNNDFIYKFSTNGDYLGKVTTDLNNTTGCQPVGVSGDPDGNIWVVNKMCNNIAKINSDNLSATSDNEDHVRLYTTGITPYTYSDFVGYALYSTQTDAQGYWRMTFDSKITHPKWDKIAFEADEPNGTNIKVRIRVADSISKLASASWTDYFDNSPADLSKVLENLEFAQIEVFFYTPDWRFSPILKSLTLSYYKE